MITKELLNPKSIAVIGGSNDVNKPGGRSLYNLLEGGFSNIFVVNPKDEVVQGIKTHKTIQDLPQVELAVICIASKFAEDVIRELCEQKSTKAIIIVSAGFSEIGKEGKELETKIVAICNANNCALIGPNCIGMLTPVYQAVIAGPIPRLENSGCDFVTSSGATAVYILEEAIARGLSFASVYSVGNGAQISVEDVVEYWDNNFELGTSPLIKMIYIESVSNPQKLLKHSQSLIYKGAKICAVKSGRFAAGSRAATSHTGALAGSDTAVDALFKKAGIIRCEGRFDLINVATILKNKELTGKNIAIVTHAGGPGVMLTDTLENVGLQIPKIEGDKANELCNKLFYGASVANPIDCLVTGTPDHIATILDYADEHFEDINASAVIYGNSGLFSPEEVYKVVYKQTKKCKKPIYHIIPSPYRTPEFTAEVFEQGHSCFTDEVAFGKALGKVYHTKRPVIENNSINIDKNKIRTIIDNAINGYLEPAQVQALLDIVEIPRAKEIVVFTKNDALNATKEIGFPLVMKVVGPIHKSDVGGVKLNIKDNITVEKTFENMMKIKDATGVLLQPMLSGTELFVGAKYENKYGHLILCGLGGIFIEVLKDVQYGLVPISKSDAKDMLTSLKSYKIIEGVRGQEGVNQELFTDIIVKLSALLEIAPEISEMDINPLLGRKDAIVAVDARIKIEK
ncbi:MAG: acetate--CoA ligase family protein [Streptococcaceae bacterium]|jgi:acetyltransferase|nr:acetate--CoA ligase family protein [Streptococcaceae bacterium]